MTEIKGRQVIGMSRTGTAINFGKNLGKASIFAKKFCRGVLINVNPAKGLFSWLKPGYMLPVCLSCL